VGQVPDLPFLKSPANSTTSRFHSPHPDKSIP
jgi:hypothetical protein